MESDDTSQIMPEERRGRGAVSNRSGRFERHAHERLDDGWEDPAPLPVLRTRVSEERPRSVINRVAAPDLNFDRSLNPYRGCEHGCVYCFARPTHAYLGLSAGLDFETRLVARPDAPRVLERELRSKSYKVAPLAIGTNTDPYQPIEKERRIMRACLEVLRDFNHPVVITTKGTLIERDIDILAAMARLGLVRVGISVTTLSADLSGRMEPRAPRPARRIRTIQRLSEAGVPVQAMVAPVVPGMTDHEIEAILQATARAGATTASWIMLRLPQEVSGLVQEWLAEHYPARAAKVMARLREMHGGRDYDPRWFHRMRGTGEYAGMVGRRFDIAARRLGLHHPPAPLECSLLEVPPRAGDQLSLF
jgi:DNA repair photolyase